MSERQPWDDYVTIDEVLDLYEQGIANHGGGHSPPKPGCLDGSLGAAANAEYYSSLGEDDLGCPGLVFAVHAMISLAYNHCFKDGNKRVAWATLNTVLARLHLRIEATDDEAEQFVIKTISSQLSAREAEIWVAERLQELGDH